MENDQSVLNINSETPLHHKFSITNVNQSVQETSLEINMDQYVSETSPNGLSFVQIKRHGGLTNPALSSNRFQFGMARNSTFEMFFYTEKSSPTVSFDDTAVIHLNHLISPSVSIL